MPVSLVQSIGDGNDLKRYLIEGSRIYTEYDLSVEQQQALLKFLHSESVSDIQSRSNSGNILSGRAIVRGCEMNGLGRVVAKSYRRGGLLKDVMSSLFMRIGQTRCRLEYKILQTVRNFGVNAPEPLAYVEDGEFWYRAWLITKEIPSTHNLIEISSKDEARAISLCREVGRQIGLLVKNGVYHIDLHPGNVVIGTNESVYLVDFDKAYEYPGNKNTLRDLFLRRWRRAVIKHKLPDILSEVVSLELRQNFTNFS